MIVPPFAALGDKSPAAEIRMRAERRLGELIKAQKETVGLNPGTRPSREHGGTMQAPPSIPTLAEIGIDKRLSSWAQRRPQAARRLLDGQAALARRVRP